MKFSFAIIMVLLSVHSFSQKGSTIIDTVKWENGKVKYIERYSDARDINHRHGNWLFFYETGELEESRYYKNGSQDSILTDYYKNGNKKEEGTLNPWRVGIWTTWFENGKMESQGVWDNVKRIGKWNFGDSTGVLASEIEYQDSIYKSTFFTYHPNGKIKSIEKYWGPYLVKAQLRDYENNITEQGVFIIADYSKDGKAFPCGNWKTFDENGILIWEKIYPE
jgi:antitoxin component YwqK of YwqJK toxin-antitoxin module